MFKLRKDARAFFSRIEDMLSRQAPLFDMFYFCLIAGIASGRRVPSITEQPTTDLVANFPGEFAGKAEQLIALMLAVELARRGVDPKDRPSLNREVDKLINPISQSYLATDGIFAMNSYAFAGCDVLRQEWFDEPPSTLDYFLLHFKRKLDEAIAGNDALQTVDLNVQEPSGDAV